MKRELKNAIWKYHFDTNELELKVFSRRDGHETVLGGYVTLNRTYMFSLMRFMISVAQKIRIEESKKLRLKMQKMRQKNKERVGKLRDRLAKKNR